MAQTYIAQDNWTDVGTLQYWGGSLGLEFRVNSPITVTALGAFDDGITSNLNGVTGSGVTIGIYSTSTQTLVGSSALFTSASAGTQIDGDAFKPTNILLGTGTYMVVAGNDDNYNDGQHGGKPASTQNTGGGAISFIGAYWGSSAGVYPSVFDGLSTGYDAGTFEYVDAAPLPPLGAGPVSLAVLGAVACLRRIRRRGA